MSGPNYDEFQRFNDPNRVQLIGWGPAIFLAFVALLIVGIVWGPDLQRRLVENSKEHLEEKRRAELAAELEFRKAQAALEAEAAYRKKEAELRAESEALAQRIKNRSIDPSPFRDVYRKAAPSVVRILALRDERAGLRGEGSGIIAHIDRANGVAHVITNSHVVHTEGEFREPKLVPQVAVTFASGRTVKVADTQIHADPLSDLAVLIVDCRDFPDLVAAEFALDDPPEQGDWAIAIGHPFGLTQTLTVGVVSAVGRLNVPAGTLDAIELVQTDAAINPGNSGGPLLDIRGRVIGVNTVIVSRSGGNQGVGFAIPTSTVMEVYQQLIVPPYTVTRGFLGVMMAGLDPEDAHKIGRQGGVIIERVMPRTPAARAGLKPGDIVISFNGKDVTGVGQLRRMVMEAAPDAVVELGLVRIERNVPVEMSLKVQLSRR